MTHGATGNGSVAAPHAPDHAGSQFDQLIVGLQPVVVVGALAQLLIRRRPFTPQNVAEALLQWSLPLNVGLIGLFGFMGHYFRSDETAGYIGWPKGNPFQKEVAFMNLASGVTGLLCTFWRGSFWWATAIANAVILLGAATVHVQEMRKTRNFNPGNAGTVFYWDILAPLAHLGLLSLLGRHGRS